MGIRNPEMEIVDDLHVNCMCDDEGPKCLECQAADRIEELEKFVVAEGECHVSHKEFEILLTEGRNKDAALIACRVKLKKLFDATDGEYFGGMEYSQLIAWIDKLTISDQVGQKP